MSRFQPTSQSPDFNGQGTASHRIQPLRIAIVSPGDRDARETATGASGRFADLFAALTEAGHHVEPAIYHDDFCTEVREQLLAVDVALVWVNPIHEGRTRQILDDMLREVATEGVAISAHPDVVLKLGTKQVLYDSRDIGWGSDTRIYRTPIELFDGISSSLVSGPRVLKQHRGSSGDGVFRAELIDAAHHPVTGDSQVLVRHAKRGSIDEVVSLSDLCAQCGGYLEGDAMIVDQEFQTRLDEGMVRCYLVRGMVAGFGHQAINALIPAAPGQDAPAPSQRFYHPPTMGEYQPLKAQLETEWVPALQELLGITDDQLPMLWDCDFLLGPPDADGRDTYVLCEINVSSVAPYPESAVAYMVEALRTQLPWGVS